MHDNRKLVSMYYSDKGCGKKNQTKERGGEWGQQRKASLRREPLSPDPAEDKRISLEAIWLKRFLGNGKQDVQRP